MFRYDADSRALSIGFQRFAKGLAFGGGAPLFRLAVALDGAGERTLEPGDFEPGACAVGTTGATLSWRKRFGNDGAVSVSVRLEQAGGEAAGTIAVEASGGALVRHVQFPVVTWGEVCHFDSLLMSAPWGDNIAKPVETIAQYCAGTGSSWIYDYVKCADGEIVYSYPSTMAMQYMALHNASRTLYVGCYGTGDSTETFHAKALGKTALRLAVGHHPFLQNGRWESPLCGLALLQGDWHAAADLYSGRMRGRFAAPDCPAWMRADGTGWNGYVQMMLRLEGQPPAFRYADLPAAYRRARDAGMETLHVAGWNLGGFDTRYPDYDADPELGGAEGLRSAIAEIHAMGGRVILYTNGRLVDPNSGFHRNGGDRCLCLDEKGNPYIERYNTSVDFRIACPDCDAYGEYLAEQVRRIAADFGADAVQIDQISCNHAYFCYDKSHSHPTPAANFLGGVSRGLQAVRRAHRSVSADFFTWCEGCHERFSQFYDVNQGHGEEHTWQLGSSIPEQFLYTYPDRLVTGMSCSLQQLCHTFAQGKPFDVPLQSLDDAEFARLLREFVAVRRAYPGFFYRGTFTDSRGIEAVGGVRAFGRRDEEENLLVTLWKPGAEARTECPALLRVAEAAPSCRAVYPAEGVTIEQSGFVLQVNWTGPAAVLLLGRA